MNTHDPGSSRRIAAPTQYFDHGFSCPAVKILPGEYFATRRRLVIVTVVGSCVVACIRDRVSGVGGLIHFMLPPTASDCTRETSNRYGERAMETLLAQLFKLGARRPMLEAKIFGGGAIASSHNNGAGERNAAFLGAYLQDAGIRTSGHDLLGPHPRKVYFFPKSGKVLVKTLRTLHNNTIIERERALLQHLGELNSTSHR